MTMKAEAVLEMIVKGQREIEEAFSKVGDAMKKVADQSEVVNSRMSGMARGLELARENMGKLTVAAATLGAAAWALNKVQREYMLSTQELQFALERQGFAMENLEPYEGVIEELSKLSTISIPELMAAIADVMTTLNIPFNEALTTVQTALGMTGTSGGTFAENLALITAVLKGDEGATAKLQDLYRYLGLTGEGLELVNKLLPEVEGNIGRLVTPLDRLGNQLSIVVLQMAKFNEALGGFPVLALAAVAGVVALAAVIGMLIAVGWVPVAIAAGIVALVTGLGLLWANWKTVWTKIQEWTTLVVDWLFESPFGKLLLFLSPVGGIIIALKNFADHWREVWDTIKQVVSNVWNTITGVIRAGVNLIISLVNTLIGALNRLPRINIPSWIPGIGGQTWGLPQIGEIPYLQKGTTSFQGGPAVVGEAGPELVSLPRGASVTPMGGMQRILIYLDSRLIAEAVIPHWTNEVRLQGV